MEKFDLIIIGTGPAGAGAAFKARSLGLSVCLVEKGDTGGTCLNRGCIPTKTLLHAADLIREEREGERYGVFAGDIRFDFGKLIEWKNTVVDSLRKNQSVALVKAGVIMETGTARVEGPGKVSVTGEDGVKSLEAAAILVAAGTAPAMVPIPGHELPGVCTSDAFLTGEGLFPKRLAIIGGGVIGVEFAAAYNAFGSEVTIIEALPSLLANMDREIGQTLALQFKKRGVGIHTGVRVEKIEQGKGQPGELAVIVSREGGENTVVSADIVLLAAGRKPDVASLFAADSIPALSPRGFIQADATMKSSISGVYVAGDLSGGIQLAHAAAAEGEYAAACIAEALEGGDRANGGKDSGGSVGSGKDGGGKASSGKDTGNKEAGRARVIPACVYTVPEIACAGLSAAEAKDRGIPAVTGKGVFGANGRAFLENQERGFIKLVFHAETQALIGAQFLCNHATEIIPWAVQCIEDGLGLEQIRRIVFPHPSYGETIAQAVNDAVTRGGL
ncbi:dihydrolipoyl dehydrogenase [Treponema primitia ZAS-2]|uniref:Dihydrolipoyl dehydrogenase n=1 Tax=Treponema primitia (strain ATCC BAA-887 / DSM 12427 / ZAS-2) TaxID=545694 RepID=F5YPL1_TREPZ|nr:NAD(P)/FAD-dependent oxidoreductase [Treponema primitia]AEF86761.1 dihydrolipoyl dehydrogenase [Treponema primitia ZAS-2]